MGPYFAEKVPKISKIATRAINVLIGIIHVIPINSIITILSEKCTNFRSYLIIFKLYSKLV